MKKYIIDRFEEDFAVLEKEEGGTINVPKSFFPDAKKGDIVTEKNGEYFVDEKLTMERKITIMKKIRRLFGKK